jgi:hypothetical protein
MRACSRIHADFFSDINEKLDAQVGSGKTRTRPVQQRIHTIVNNIRDAGFIVDRYSLLTDKMLSDFNEKIFSVEIIKNYARRFPYKDNISTTLRQLGLTSVKAAHVQTIFEPLIGDSYTKEQIIDLSIEYLFGISSPLLGDKTTTHYYQPEIIDKWFRGTEGKLFYNFPGRCDESTIKNIYAAIERMLPLSLSQDNDDYELYYHMTSWSWADEICQQILYSAGMPYLDFGWNGSFYVSNKLKNAIDWSKKKSKALGNEIAIVVFRIPKIFPPHLKYKELAGDEWITITKKSRLCSDEARVKVTEMSELRRIDFVYGPMVSNGDDVVSKYVNPKTHNPPKYQLASKTDAGCNYLHDNILGILFFQKYIPK